MTCLLAPALAVFAVLIVWRFVAAVLDEERDADLRPRFRRRGYNPPPVRNVKRPPAPPRAPAKRWR